MVNRFSLSISVFLFLTVSCTNCSRSHHDEYSAASFDSDAMRKAGFRSGPVSFSDIEHGAVCIVRGEESIIYCTADGAKSWAYHSTVKGRCVQMESMNDTLKAVFYCGKDKMVSVYNGKIGERKWVAAQSFVLSGNIARLNHGYIRNNGVLSGTGIHLFENGLIGIVMSNKIAFVTRSGVLIKEYPIDVPDGSQVAFCSRGTIVLNSPGSNYLSCFSPSSYASFDAGGSVLYLEGADQFLLVGRMHGIEAMSIDESGIHHKGIVSKDGDMPRWLCKSGDKLYAYCQRLSLETPWTRLFVSDNDGRTWKLICREWLINRSSDITNHNIHPCATPQGVILYTPEGKVYTVRVRR